MKVLKMFPEVKKEAVSYDRILDGRVWELERGTDFEGNVQLMRMRISSAARARGTKVRTHKIDEGHLVVQKVA